MAIEVKKAKHEEFPATISKILTKFVYQFLHTTNIAIL